NFAALKECDPPLPPTAFNRLADNWRPLFAVAQIAGGDWPTRALAAFERLSRGSTFNLQPSTFNRQPSPSTINQQQSTLLAAFRHAFALAGTDRLTTKQLLSALNQSGVRLRSARDLARLLAPCGIQPTTVRSGNIRGKGYYLAGFPAQ